MPNIDFWNRLEITTCPTESLNENFLPWISSSDMKIFDREPRWDFSWRGFCAGWEIGHRGCRVGGIFTIQAIATLDPPRMTFWGAEEFVLRAIWELFYRVSNSEPPRRSCEEAFEKNITEDRLIEPPGSSWGEQFERKSEPRADILRPGTLYRSVG